jgi:hypothetical protein
MLANNYVTSTADYEFGGAEEAVLAFASDYPELVGSAVDGLTSLLRDWPDEPARDGELEQLGWGYAPQRGKLDSFLEWARVTLSAGVTEIATG